MRHENRHKTQHESILLLTKELSTAVPQEFNTRSNFVDPCAVFFFLCAWPPRNQCIPVSSPPPSGFYANGEKRLREIRKERWEFGGISTRNEVRKSRIGQRNLLSSTTSPPPPPLSPLTTKPERPTSWHTHPGGTGWWRNGRRSSTPPIFSLIFYQMTSLYPSISLSSPHLLRWFAVPVKASSPTSCVCVFGRLKSLFGSVSK